MLKLLNKHSIIILSLITACGFSAWVAGKYLSPTKSDKHSSKSADSFMSGVNYTLYDKTGSWQTQFSTPYLQHFSDHDSTQIDRPHLISRGQDGLTWFISATHGTSQNGSSTVYLQDNVKIERVNQNQQTADLTTTSLTAYPKRKFVETDQPVHIIQPGSTIESVGLTADLNTGDINLLSASRGVYVQQTP